MEGKTVGEREEILKGWRERIGEIIMREERD